MAKYQGVIKSFNAQKGWGFIECAQTQQLYGKDMFVLKNSLPGGAATKGDQVSFAVVQEHNGPVASDVQFLRRAPVSQGLNVGGPALPTLNSHAPAPANGAGAGETYLGTVKSFRPETGWGMIACPQLFQTYQKDVFFSNKHIVQGAHPAQGDQVAFTVKMEDKGPAAASVQVLWKQPAPQPMAALALPTFHPVPAAGGKWTTPAPGGPAVQPKIVSRNQTFFGTLKSFNDEKGWGHISCDATNKLYGKDVFLMSGALQGQSVQPGVMLSFKVNMAQKGPQAADVTVHAPGSFHLTSDPPSDDSMVYVGQIKSFNAEKGWGFVTSEDLVQTFGKDIFIHKRELDGRAPSIGEEVRISVEIDQGGQPVAKAASNPAIYDARQHFQSGGARVAPY